MLIYSNVQSYKAPQHWAELYCSWSPEGTLLATVHRPGVKVWAGPSMAAMQRFPHPGVRLIDFSPNERYLATWSNDPIVADGTPANASFGPEDEGNNLAVWEVKTGALLRTFPLVPPDGPHGGDDGSAGRAPRRHISWPVLRWSPDDCYVARVTPGQQISIYELPSMGLLDKKSIKIDGVVDVEWCPLGDRDREEAEKDAQLNVGSASAAKGKKVRENMLVYWTPEVVNQPARVSLMSIPSRTVLRSKNLFNVSEVRILPHLTVFLFGSRTAVPRGPVRVGSAAQRSSP